jgi:hypothetical protein
MGMEGKLRQVSEFELAAFKKNPAKFYARFIDGYDLESLGKLNAKIREVMESPLSQKIRQRALSGLQPLPEDVAEMQRQMQALLNQNPKAQAVLETQHIGLSKDGAQLPLHKSWHCVHYLLTGKSWDPAEPPLGNAIMGGTELADRQRVMGYGPARYLTPFQVREVADALSNYPIEEKVELFDPKAAEIAKVYPFMHGKEELGKDEQEDLIHYFHLLRDFYRDASTKGHAMLLWVE